MAEQRRGSDGTLVEVREPKKEEVRDPKAAARDAKAERDKEIKEVRASDIEPYTGLRYLSKLFRFMGVILVLLLVAEVATGVYTQGSAAIPTLLGEASRLIVLAGVLWGTGDLAHLLIDIGHDVRASRILVARVAHAAKVPPLTPARQLTAPDRKAIERANNAAMTDRSVSRTNLSDHELGGDDGPPIP